MLTLKEIIQVKLAAQFMNDLDTRQIIMCSKNEIWSEVIRKETSALCIPFTLQEDIIASIKPIKLKIFDWLDDHNGIFTKKQEDSLKFCFNADGVVDRVKTADLLIHLEGLDVQTRFLLACQYWSRWHVLAFLKIYRTLRGRKFYTSIQQQMRT
ncbi:hypothetical protein TNIN_300381 [Trichonephila inaurata madagascariensis]|uniref:Uncharacterized protein n=1 Tax=Trichonephila inaurata madagascariensis TaxID=2747483 RepID=A0A8X7CHK8_9ARAC|nr:hypothetical protein TNIN_300381 [Trichonephila inaurata madagascariensis]